MKKNFKFHKLILKVFLAFFVVSLFPNLAAAKSFFSYLTTPIKQIQHDLKATGNHSCCDHQENESHNQHESHDCKQCSQKECACNDGIAPSGQLLLSTQTELSYSTREEQIFISENLEPDQAFPLV
jgi:hypothetical protein